MRDKLPLLLSKMIRSALRRFRVGDDDDDDERCVESLSASVRDFFDGFDSVATGSVAERLFELVGVVEILTSNDAMQMNSEK